MFALVGLVSIIATPHTRTHHSIPLPSPPPLPRPSCARLVDCSCDQHSLEKYYGQYRSRFSCHTLTPLALSQPFPSLTPSPSLFLLTLVCTCGSGVPKILRYQQHSAAIVRLCCNLKCLSICRALRWITILTFGFYKLNTRSLTHLAMRKNLCVHCFVYVCKSERDLYHKFEYATHGMAWHAMPFWTNSPDVSLCVWVCVCNVQVNQTNLFNI